MWRRWSKEYLRALRERLRTQNTSQGNAPAVGDVVILQADERNRFKWPLGIVENLKVDTDGVVRGAVLWSGTSRVERAVQQLYPSELLCDRQQPRPAAMNPQFHPSDREGMRPLRPVYAYKTLLKKKSDFKLTIH